MFWNKLEQGDKFAVTPHDLGAVRVPPSPVRDQP